VSSSSFGALAVALTFVACVTACTAANCNWFLVYYFNLACSTSAHVTHCVMKLVLETNMHLIMDATCSMT
jgi:hypothetical protein